VIFWPATRLKGATVWGLGKSHPGPRAPFRSLKPLLRPGGSLFVSRSEVVGPNTALVHPLRPSLIDFEGGL
jgi:hypothetical protein